MVGPLGDVTSLVRAILLQIAIRIGRPLVDGWVVQSLKQYLGDMCTFHLFPFLSDNPEMQYSKVETFANIWGFTSDIVDLVQEEIEKVAASNVAKHLLPEDQTISELNIELAPPTRFTSDEVVRSLLQQIDQIADPLGRLVMLDEVNRQLSTELMDRMMASAAEARAEGATWKSIASSLNVSPQAVQARFTTAGRKRNASRRRIK